MIPKSKVNNLAESALERPQSIGPAYREPPTLKSTIFVITLIAMWEGVPFTFLGFDDSLGCKIVAIVALLGLPLFWLKSASGSVRFTAYHASAIAFVLWCVLISFNFNTFVEPKPIAQWLPSAYIVMPITLIFILQATGTKISDCENAIIFAGLIGSIFAIIDSLLDLGLLSFYQRSGSDGAIRIVFFKMPALFAFIICFTKIFIGRNLGSVIGYSVISIITLYNVVVLTESRLSLGGIIIAIFCIFLYVLRGARRVYLGITIIVGGIPALSYIADKFLSNFVSFDQYFKSDVSAWFRSREIEHFSAAFDRTQGLGFGFMSLNAAYNNTLTFAAYEAGRLVGTGKYGMALTDIGLYSALYQFGYVGLVSILFLTFLTGVTLIRSRRLGIDFYTTSAFGCLMLSLLVSPISINFFTIQFAAHLGAIAYFMAAECSQLSRRYGVIHLSTVQ